MSAHSDTAFLRMFLLVLGALVAFTVIIVIAANLIGDDVAELQADDPMRRAAIAERIEPIGKVNVTGGAPGGPATAEAAAATVGGQRSGAAVYAAVCMACHSTGVAESPRIGDKAAWAPRLEQGLAKMVETVITGKGAMPPRGGDSSATDEEIREAVVHMLAETGLEPADQPATAAAPATEPAAAEQESGTEAAGDGDGIADAGEGPDAAPAGNEASGGMAAAEQEAVSGPDSAVPEGESAGAAEVPDTMVAKVSEAVDGDGEVGVDLEKGQQVYQTACLACHGTGVAGAPKLGDTADWEPRIAQGSETLLTHAINGYQGAKGYMPPKGGFASLSDSDVAAAIAYMVNESR